MNGRFYKNDELEFIVNKSTMERTYFDFFNNSVLCMLFSFNGQAIFLA